MEIDGKGKIIFLDLQGTAFKNAQRSENPNEVQKMYNDIMDLLNGKEIEKIAEKYGETSYVEGIMNNERFSKMPPKAAKFIIGDMLLEHLQKIKKIKYEEVIGARIEAVRLRDEHIISEILHEFPKIDIGTTTQDAQTIHEVISHYLSEISERLQIVSTDKDIAQYDEKGNLIPTNKDETQFYHKASARIYLPTSKMILVDDKQKNVDAMKNSGGNGKIFNKDEKELADTVIEAIEDSYDR